MNQLCQNMTRGSSVPIGFKDKSLSASGNLTEVPKRQRSIAQCLRIGSRRPRVFLPKGFRFGFPNRFYKRCEGEPNPRSLKLGPGLTSGDRCWRRFQKEMPNGPIENSGEPDEHSYLWINTVGLQDAYVGLRRIHLRRKVALRPAVILSKIPYVVSERLKFRVLCNVNRSIIRHIRPSLVSASGILGSCGPPKRLLYYPESP